jgi:hypothetical protein
VGIVFPHRCRNVFFSDPGMAVVGEEEQNLDITCV